MADDAEWNMNWSHGGVPLDLIKPKLLVIGYGRHGKDTVSEILCREMDLNYQSSSEFCAGHVMFPTLSKNNGTLEDLEYNVKTLIKNRLV